MWYDSMIVWHVTISSMIVDQLMIRHCTLHTVIVASMRDKDRRIMPRASMGDTNRKMLVNFVLLCSLIGQTVGKVVNMGDNPRVLREKNITITECDMDYYDNDDYLTDPEECHRAQMTNETIQEKYRVRSCCDFHGYMANGQCSGTDKDVGIWDKTDKDVGICDKTNKDVGI